MHDVGAMPVADGGADVVLALGELFGACRGRGCVRVGCVQTGRGAVDASEANLVDEAGLGVILACLEDFNLTSDQTVERGDVVVILRIAEGATTGGV